MYARRAELANQLYDILQEHADCGTICANTAYNLAVSRLFPSDMVDSTLGLLVFQNRIREVRKNGSVVYQV